LVLYYRYMSKRRIHHRLSYFISSFTTVIGLVLIWRGIWYLLDWIDKEFFNDGHILTVPITILVGFLILYLPDRDLSELRKL